MPGEAGHRSVHRVCVHLPRPACHCDQIVDLRWPGILGGAEATVEGAIPLVADWSGSNPHLAGPPGPVIAGRGKPGNQSRTGMARRELKPEKGLRSKTFS